VRSDRLPDFDDQTFALDLLEHKHVLVAPGSSFNVPYRNHFRVTNLPEPAVLTDVFGASRTARELCSRGSSRDACGTATACGRRSGLISVLAHEPDVISK
jgi:alanine-synthesizing transaminase